MADFAVQNGESGAAWLARLEAIDRASLGGWDRVSLSNHLDSAPRRAERQGKEPGAAPGGTNLPQTPLEQIKLLCDKLSAEERRGLVEWLQTRTGDAAPRG